MKGIRSGKVMSTAAMAFLFLLATISGNVFAQGEGGIDPDSYSVVDPSIHGKLVGKYIPPGGSTLCPNYLSNGCLEYSFTGRCKDKTGRDVPSTLVYKISGTIPLTKPPIDVDINAVYSQADLVGGVLENRAPLDCRPDSASGHLYIYSAANWHDTFDAQMLRGDAVGHLIVDLQLMNMVLK